MSAGKHTPVIRVEGSAIIYAHPGFKKLECRTREDAVLYAAAPRLLDALQVILAAVNAKNATEPSLAQFACAPELRAIIKTAAQSAIARSTNQTDDREIKP